MQGMQQLQLFPALPSAVEAALRASIERFGVLVPVVQDQHGRVLDGHHRSRLADALGVTYRVDTVVVRDEDEAREIQRTLNSDRRQLTEEQRQEIALALRQEGHSYRAIGGALGVSEAQAWHDVNESTVNHLTVELPDRVMGLDGKERPARRLPLVPAMTPEHASHVQEMLTTEAERPLKTCDVCGQSWLADLGGCPYCNRTPEERIRGLHESQLLETPERPHVAYNTGVEEWYTPPELLDAARAAMGGIDCDPASSAVANERVQARVFYDAADDGLAHPWGGSVWLNPPYAQPAISAFAEAVCARFAEAQIERACVLVNNATETAWCQRLLGAAAAVCFVRGRVRFLDPAGRPGAPLQGQLVLYLGGEPERFAAAFAAHGPVWSAPCPR